MPRLAEHEREQAIGMLRSGMTEARVARHFRVHRCTISRLQIRYAETGATADRPRPGQPRVTTRAQDRHMRVSHLRDRFLPASRTAAETIGRHQRQISSRTVRRRLRDQGIRSYRANVGLVLTDRRRETRRTWGRRYSNRNWRNANWRHVVFSDESRFTLFRNDARRRVYRRRGERFADPCVVQGDRFGGGGVMAWAAIRYGWRSNLVFIDGTLNGQRYRDNILLQHVVPYVTRNPGVTFMHDNARPHVARICQACLAENNVQVMDWPPYSPDMNPIEHLWDNLDRRVRRRVPLPRTVAELRTALLEEWEAIPMADINTLVTSMPRRVQALMDANGGHTRY